MRRDLMVLLETARILGMLVIQMLLFPAVFLTILALKLADKEDAATEVEDWWLHL